MLGLLGLVLVVGKKVYGAYRWLEIFGLPVQPSEFAKVALVLVLARMLASPVVRPRSFWTVLGALALAAAPFVLILKEPDLGTAMIFLPVAALMLFAAGASLRHLMGLGALAVALAPWAGSCWAITSASAS